MESSNRQTPDTAAGDDRDTQLGYPSDVTEDCKPLISMETRRGKKRTKPEDMSKRNIEKKTEKEIKLANGKRFFWSEMNKTAPQGPTDQLSIGGSHGEAGHTEIKQIKLVNGKTMLWDKGNKIIAVQLPPPPPLPLPPPLPFLLAQGHAEKFSSDRSSGGGTGA